MEPLRIDETRFAGEAQLRGWCERIGGEGLRSTGSDAHERLIDWVIDQLDLIPEVSVRVEVAEVLRWQPIPEGDLEQAGTLRVDGTEVAIAGAVPYSHPSTAGGPLVHLPVGTAITADNAAGRVVLRDFPEIPLPYDLLLDLGLHVTPDCDELRGEIWDRPGLADTILHEDLLAAGAAGAAGVVVAFDLPRPQVVGYFEPHKGTHYRIPAVFVGVDEREALRAHAAAGAAAEVAVRAVVERAPTRTIIATLRGPSPERAVLVTHTDGNTWVQENGIAALLALAQYFSALPEGLRHRTVELAFTTAHLHISREGAAAHAARLDDQYEAGEVAYAFAIEHLGARELVPVPRPDGPGRHLVFAEGSDPILWAAGPSDAIRGAVVDAVTRRDLERVVVAPGFGAPVEGQVPPIVSFGGLGTYFNLHLVPTTSIITGPWSLWAPAFGADAVDIRRLRQQAIAAGDVVLALDRVPRDQIAGDYLAQRSARASGAPVGTEPVPPELAP